jgi:hypothetical protein
MSRDIGVLYQEAGAFEATLAAAKARAARSDFPWYPYRTLLNLENLDRLLSGGNRGVFEGCRRVADIGAADGELAFFLESKGMRVDAIDHAATNFNQLRGARALKKALRSSVEIHDVDLDARFRLPRERYDLIVFLGILYHLKNPYSIMETLARATRWCLLSTRIARFAGDPRTLIEPLPVAYLLDPQECNDDSTNFWIFTDTGLRRLLARTGWEIRDWVSLGNTTDSDPATAAGDERAFLLAESRVAAT